MRRDDLGKLMLRLLVGILILFHAYGFFRGDPGIPNAMAALHLPAFFADIGVFLEVAGAVSVIFGIYPEIGALMILLFMLLALGMYHVTEVPGLHGSGNHLLLLGKNPAGTHFDKYFLESQVFYLFGALVIALLGPGRYCVYRATSAPAVSRP